MMDKPKMVLAVMTLTLMSLEDSIRVFRYLILVRNETQEPRAVSG